ncbi:MAG TPA: hypothetical protein VHL59_18350, partial [Thermoanaerobaculia bacterium]|nr:hypothetical protein [Thermoanaerobaculia bacterium]
MRAISWIAASVGVSFSGGTCTTSVARRTSPSRQMWERVTEPPAASAVFITASDALTASSATIFTFAMRPAGASSRAQAA